MINYWFLPLGNDCNDCIHQEDGAATVTPPRPVPDVLLFVKLQISIAVFVIFQMMKYRFLSLGL